MGSLYADANLIAHWANLGYVEEAAIRNRILQSLIFHPRPCDHQAHTLILLFKLAGSTFRAHADPSVVDRCLEILDSHRHCTSVEWGLIQVRVPRPVNRGRRAETNFQWLVGSRGYVRTGLPSTPMFVIREPEQTEVNQWDPAAALVNTSLGLPRRDLESQIAQHPPLELETSPGTSTVPESPLAQSPSISIATLFDFTISDISDDEFSTDPAEEVPHEIFYLEDGNVEVLCGNIIFRVHTIILSFHSPVLSRVFDQTNLAAAESPNGCPRIQTSDAAMDFTTLLKAICLPGFVALPGCCWYFLLTI